MHSSVLLRSSSSARLFGAFVGADEFVECHGRYFRTCASQAQALPGARHVRVVRQRLPLLRRRPVHTPGVYLSVSAVHNHEHEITYAMYMYMYFIIVC